MSAPVERQCGYTGGTCTRCGCLLECHAMRLVSEAGSRSTPGPIELELTAAGVQALRDWVVANYGSPRETTRTEFVKGIARAANGFGADLLREGEIQVFADLLALRQRPVELFAVFRHGVYRHECGGIFESCEAAWTAAHALIRGEPDDYHSFKVVPFQLGKVAAADLESVPLLFGLVESRPVLELARSAGVVTETRP